MGSKNPDGTVNQPNSYANLTNSTNYWHGLTNVMAIVVALGILAAPDSTGSTLALATILPAIVAAIVAAAAAGKPATVDTDDASTSPTEADTAHEVTR